MHAQFVTLFRKSVEAYRLPLPKDSRDLRRRDLYRSIENLKTYIEPTADMLSNSFGCSVLKMSIREILSTIKSSLMDIQSASKPRNHIISVLRF